MMQQAGSGLLSIVVPLFNEEDVVRLFFAATEAVLVEADIPFEFICVNDGSTDGTLAILKDCADEDARIKIVNLSRNYGKEVALTAGLDHASGRAVVPMDCDLQDPPDLLPQMYARWQEGYHVVMAKRRARQTDSAFRRVSARLFYKVMAKVSEVAIPENVGDFRLLDRQVVEAVKEFPERSRFMKGLFANVGFRQITVEYDRPSRVAGESKWSYFQLYRLALDGIFAFTSFPLRMWSYIGATFAFFAFIYAVYLIIKTLTFGVDVPGYASLMVVILFSTSAILICLGVIGEYLSRIYIEVKQRPLYVVMDKIGFDE